MTALVSASSTAIVTEVVASESVETSDSVVVILVFFVFAVDVLDVDTWANELPTEELKPAGGVSVNKFFALSVIDVIDEKPAD
jgi:hypothetical protein